MKPSALRSAVLPLLLCCLFQFAAVAQSNQLPLAGCPIFWGVDSYQVENSSPNVTNVVAISAAAVNALLLTGDGAVLSWDGSNLSPTGVTNGIAIGAGDENDIVLKSDGTVFAWGENQEGETNVPASLSNVVAIAAGGEHFLALLSDGGVVAWGDDSFGQTSVPSGLSGVKAVAAGALQSLALLSNGTLVAWGYDTFNTPNTGDYLAIAEGFAHGMALRSDSTVDAWGYLGYGSDSGATNVPPGLSNVIAISSGEAQCTALLSNGTVVAWGRVPMVPFGLTNATGLGSDANSYFNTAIYNGVPCLMSWPANQSLYSGTSTLLSVSPVGPGPFAYQWLLDGTNIPSATSSALNLTNIPAANSGDYTVLVTNQFGSITSPTAQISVSNSPPIILTPPTNQLALVTSNAEFSVSVTGSMPLACQWQLDGANIPAATNFTLLLTNVQLSQSAGSYTVLVSNQFGSAAVSNVILTVVPFLITEQPQDLATNNGFTATLDVSVIGPPPLSYQWQFDGSNIAGATTSALILTNAVVSQSGSYDVIVSNAWGVQTSSNAVVTVLPDSLAIEPSSLTTNGGANVTFTSTIAGPGPFNYQWQFNGTNLPGSTNSALSLDNVLDIQSGPYTLVASNIYGYSTVTATATLNVIPWVAVYISPSSIVAGASSTVSISAGTGGLSPPSFQWFQNDQPWGGPGPGGATDIYAPGMNWAGTYTLIASDSLYSLTNSATLTVIPLVITSQPANRVAWIGSSNFFTVTAAGATPIAYQWQFDGTSIPGATTNLLQLTNIQPTEFGTYSVIVSNAYTNITSSSAFLLPSQVAVWGGIDNESNLPPNLTNITAISAGSLGGCQVLADNNKVINWAYTSAAQSVTNAIAITGYNPALDLLGNGSVYRLAAEGLAAISQGVVLPGLSNIIEISSFGSSYAVLKSDGTVLYGLLSPATSGQVTNTSPGLGNIVAVAQGYAFALALSNNGTITGWGDNTYGQLNIPRSATNIIAIAAGAFHSVAMTSAGTVAAWGNNQYGQCIVPSGLSNVIAIAAGAYHTIALKKDGTVIAWGLNEYGETTIPSGLTNVSAIAGGEYLSMALIGTAPPPLQAPITNPVLTSNAFTFTLPSQSGRIYDIEYKTNLTDTNWTSLSLTPGAGQSIQLTDPTATNAQRFYRIQRW
jgi:alpha-tubulin suppressor-like RCC1 family protein